MIVLLAAALGSGLVTVALLAPISLLAAAIIAPLIASTAAVLACFLIAWRSTQEPSAILIDAQTDAMVASLRDVAHQAQGRSSAPTVRSRRNRVA
jgi:hypothetical protein